MRARSLTLRNFRNHAETELTELAPQINAFVGPNGAGKTSILEALSLATLTKSFTSHSDAVLIREHETALTVEADFTTDLGVPHRVSVSVEAGPPIRKTIIANSDRLRSYADLIGLAPVVIITPDEKVITGGSPSERRRFLDLVLSQASRSYLKDEIEYRRAIKHRNAILATLRQERRSLASAEAMLTPWTVLAIENGARIMQRRAAFALAFRPRLLKAYAEISTSRETPSVDYLPMGEPILGMTEREDFVDFLTAQSQKCQSDEARRGSTLFGPHRDEVLLSINPGQEARLYASQGQHKTLLVAMKLAEFEFLRDASHETPILLLDDVFSELDDLRAGQLLQLAESGTLGQTFITSTERGRFERYFREAAGEHRLVEVAGGQAGLTA